jgi:hypothetical protein
LRAPSWRLRTFPESTLDNGAVHPGNAPHDAARRLTSAAPVTLRAAPATLRAARRAIGTLRSAEPRRPAGAGIG